MKDYREPTRSRLARSLCALLAAVLLAAPLAAPLLEVTPALAADPAQTGVTPGGSAAGAAALHDCSTVAEDTLQGELNTVTQQIFAVQLQTLDLDTLVNSQWAALRIDATLDAAVDRAVTRVQSETDEWNKFLSGWNPDLAKDLTLTVANYTFADPALHARLDDLSAAVSKDVADRLALASADSVSAALYCLQTFIGRNYSQALVGAFAARVQAATDNADLVDVNTSPDLLKLAGTHQMALGGVGVIIAAQITRRIVTEIAASLSERLVGRILGKVGSSIIPIAGWLIGTGMIAYDVWTNRDGALPQIQESIKSEEVKAGLRAEIADSIQPELEAELPGLARTIANDLYGQWRDTKRNIRQVIDLANVYPQFGLILASMQSPEQVSRLVALVSAVQKHGGDPALSQAISDGSLRQVADLSAGAVTLVQETGSLQTALAWAKAVGSRLDDVVTYGLYKSRTPETINVAQLDQLLALKDQAAITRVAALKPVQTDALLLLPPDYLVQLAGQLAPDALAWLGDTLPTLTSEQQAVVVARILTQPAVVPELRRLGNLRALADSGNLNAAISFVAGPKDAGAFWTDGASVLTGGAPFALFEAKHGIWPTVGFSVAVLLLALIALRLFYGMGQWLVEPLTLLRKKR